MQLDQLISSQTILFEQLLNLTNEKIGHAITYSENGIEKTIHAKYIIDATGRNRALLKILNISTVDYDKTLSFSCHLPKKTHPKIKHNVFVESFREGWGLVSRLDENQNIISIFTNSQSSIFNAVKEYSNWPAILQETQYLKHFLSSQEKVKIRGGQSNSSKPAHSAGEHWMAIGDAALAFDPLCSHGITNAIYTAKSAAEALAGALKNEDQGKNLFAAYDQSMGDIFQAYLRSRQGLYTSEKRWPDSSFWQAQIGHTLAAV